MQLDPDELDQMLRRADAQRRVLRRATRELLACGEAMLRARDEARGDRPR